MYDYDICFTYYVIICLHLHFTIHSSGCWLPTSPYVEWLHEALETVPIHLCDNPGWCVLSSRLSGVRDEDAQTGTQTIHRVQISRQHRNGAFSIHS